MKNIRTKLCVTALALVVGVSPVLGCTAVPKANTSRPTVAEAQEERKSTTPTVKPETKPAPKPETKPVVPETKPTVPTPKPVLPAPTVKPETKPAVPTPQPVLPTPTVPETKPAVPAPKPILPTPTVKPEIKPAVPAPTVKPETKPVVPETKPTPVPEVKPAPSTCEPCKSKEKPCKPETKPCKPGAKSCKPEAKPAGKFTIDNFKIIQQSLEKLGVSPSELEVMIKEGKKLIDVLNEKNIPVNKFRKVLYKEYCLTIKNGVKNKQITKEEGKLLQAAIKQKVMSWMKDK